MVIESDGNGFRGSHPGAQRLSKAITHRCIDIFMKGGLTNAISKQTQAALLNECLQPPL
jgi:hypothetical protein